MRTKKLTYRQKATVLTTIGTMLHRFANRYGNEFYQDGVCVETSRAFSKALRQNKIPHKRVVGGQAEKIGWHCWVELPEIGIIDFCAGQADEKDDNWVDVVIGMKSEAQIYDETAHRAKVTEYYNG